MHAIKGKDVNLGVKLSLLKSYQRFAGCLSHEPSLMALAPTSLL